MFALKDNEALLAMKEKLQADRLRLKGIVKTTARGFGFLELDDGRSAFIQKSLMKGLLPQTEVEVVAEEGDKGLTVSEVSSIIGHGQVEFFCRIEVFSVDDREYANAIPLRNDVGIKIQLGQAKRQKLIEGDIALVEIKESQVIGNDKYKGRIKVNLGHESSPQTIWSLIKQEFSLNEPLEEVTVSSLPDFGNPKYWIGQRGYKDLTDIPLCTIDSYSSRDLDDALHVEDLGDSWKLTVAIADPTCIVEDDHSLRELFVSRGVTHYLATEIIHLMAKFFSEDNFSLLENEVRPALVGTISVNKATGVSQLKNIEIGIIESRVKLSYEQVSEHIKQRAVPVIDDLPEIALSLNHLHDMSVARRRYREDSQYVGVDDKEYFFVIENGTPVSVKEIVKTLAHSMVEEAAIAANMSFAEWATENNLPIVYVTHKGFSEDKQANVKEYLKTRGVELSGSESSKDLFDIAHSHLYKRIVESKGESDAYKQALAKKDLVELRGFYQKGVFSLCPEPHMPMGMKQYATWTSPIRKAVDMLNHLVIKSFLKGGGVAGITQAEIDSIQERNRSSRQAERRLTRLLGLTYLKQLAGEVVDATLTQVMSRSVRFEINGTGISITMGIQELGIKGFARLDAVSQSISVDDNVILQLSDQCKIKVSSVDVYAGAISAIRIDDNAECIEHASES